MKKLFNGIDALKGEIDQHRPLDIHLLGQIKEYYRIGLTYSSNAIEGNTLTETETKIVLEDGITIGGKPLKDHLEVIGHSDAYDFLYACAKKKSFSEEDINQLHHLFYYRIDEKNAGVYRKVKVYITGSKYPLPDPSKISGLMQEWIEKTQKQREELHPIEFAAQAHKDFVFIHPFIDGNGRVARLLMNLILLQEGYTISIIPPMMRAEYINGLERAHISDQEFIEFIARMVKETQRDYLRLFR
jgi:Fic family protein